MQLSLLTHHRSTLDKIIANFLLGMKDYSFDSRGDVGSWVREASMRGIKLIMVIGKNELAKIGMGIRSDMIGFLVLACLEKIDRVRESAGKILNFLLDDEHIAIPERAFLRLAFNSSNTESINWLSSAEVLPVMTKCLHIPSLRDLVMTGIMLNIGGLTESLVRHSTDSFNQFVSDLPSQLSPQMEPTTAQHILESMRNVFAENIGNDRVSIPILETLDLYLSFGFLSGINDGGPVREIFNMVKKEVFKSKNTKKLLVGIKVLTGFGSLSDDEKSDEFQSVQKLSVEKLILYLGHPYPIIRTSSAESLYVLVSTTLISTHDPENLSLAEELLLTFKWDSSCDDCKIARQQITEFLAV